MRIGDAIAQNQLDIFPGIACALLAHEAQIVLLGDAEIDIDWVNRRNRGHYRVGGHEIPDSDFRDARDSGYWRDNGSPAAVQPRIVEAGFSGFDFGLRGALEAFGLVEFGLANGLLGNERRISLHVNLRLNKRG